MCAQPCTREQLSVDLKPPNQPEQIDESLEEWNCERIANELV